MQEYLALADNARAEFEMCRNQYFEIFNILGRKQARHVENEV